MQNFKDEINLNTHDIERMQQVIKTIPTTEHITLSTAKMELELTEMEATIHTLSARVQVLLEITKSRHRHLQLVFFFLLILTHVLALLQDLRKRVQEQLGYWQDYEHAYSNVSQMLYQSQATVQFLLNEVPNSSQAIGSFQRYIQVRNKLTF